MSSSNCVSTYFMAEKFDNSELLDSARKFILSNFAKVAQTENFLRLPSHEVEQLVSSDDVVVNSEEDIVKAIIKWTILKKSERSKEFCNLFRHVRLTFLSRDFLLNNVVTNELVTENEDCVDRVNSALAWMDRKTDCDLSRPYSPRKALEKCVIAIWGEDKPFRPLFYVPENNDFCHLPGMTEPDCVPQHVFSCRGKLFFVAQEVNKSQYYDPDFNCWRPAPWTKTDSRVNWCKTNRQEIGKLFFRAVVVVENEICFIEDNLQTYSSSLCKFNLDTNFTTRSKDWVTTIRTCLVTLGQYIYVIGGTKSDVDIVAHCSRYDIVENTWQKLTNLRLARFRALGVATQEKIYVGGGWLDFGGEITNTCEVYSVITDEWHLMGGLTVPRDIGNMLSIDESLYALGGVCHPVLGKIWSVESYEHGKDEWRENRHILDIHKIMTFRACTFRMLNDVSVKLKHHGNC
ncbi:kelch-like protein 17 [Stylophora pistillata]|uniref:kelch-like protein 17 n=1 Tax=Stylophora pistillata TaxID=50429 RepID=UPI000C04FE37|nr:kelch-like protein 17 [Stylophora pistillata]